MTHEKIVLFAILALCAYVAYSIYTRPKKQSYGHKTNGAPIIPGQVRY
jgi:hypothetical protein